MEFSLDPETLSFVLEEPSLWGLALGFAAGLVFSFNPLVFASVPVVLAYVAPSASPRRALALAAAFAGGMLAAHVALGIAAALGGEWARALMGRWWGVVLGPVLVLLGLAWAGWLRLTIPWFTVRGRPATGPWGAFLLGIPFSVAVCPVCTPALLVMVSAAAAAGSVAFGAALLAAFALGRSVPLLVGALAVGWLERLRAATAWSRRLDLAAGLVLVATGLYMIYEAFFIM